LQYLGQISDGDKEFELELLNLFVEDAKIHIDAAAVATKNQNYKALEREAHHLKGSSANVGAQLIQGLAYTIEQQSLQHSIEGVPEKIIELQSYLTEIEAFISLNYKIIN